MTETDAGSVMAEVMLHMTATMNLPDGSFLWFCRCGAQQDGYSDRAFARTAGDAHLAEVNAHE